MNYFDDMLHIRFFNNLNIVRNSYQDQQMDTWIIGTSRATTGKLIIATTNFIFFGQLNT